MSEQNNSKNEPNTNVAIADAVEVSSLRTKAGPLRRIGVAFITSSAAGRELASVETARVRVIGGIARTALALAEVKIKSAMVASAMPEIGALAVTLNSRTTAVDQALTNGAAAEVVTHIENRAENLALSRELRAQNKISEEEAATIDAFANSDAVTDIESSRLREEQAKQVVQHLHGLALGSISKIKIGID